MTHLQKLKSIRLCLSAHPDNEPNSEFADRISDLDELIKSQEDVDAALLDDFAKAAMQGIVASSSEMRAHGASFGDDGYYPVSSLAKEAYDIAEALIQERNRRMKG